MTTETLTAIKAALARVEDREWFVYGEPEVGYRHTVHCMTPSKYGEHEPVWEDPSKVEFIAAANPSAISSLISSYEAMERRVAELEEALTPFANYRTADGIYGTDFLRIPDGHPVLFNMKSLGEFAAVDFTVTIGDFRRARSSLTPTVETVEKPSQAPAPEAHTTGTLDVLAERRRQIEVEDFDASHDDMATKGQLATAAACYVIHASHLGSEIESFWPWDMKWWKPSGRRHDLVKAAALILAEIDRIDRAVSALSTEGQDNG